MYIICGLIANTTNVHKHNSFVIYTYSYCVYALVGGGELVFMVRISMLFSGLCQRIACCLPRVCCLCSENVAIGFKTSIKANFVGKNSARTPALLEVSKLRHKF